MRLRTLRIKGFKSFGDETILNFGENVIGVVGPNGSGKSNIVDAIRWVLGEQKGKELRLDSMGDVLFNGTKKRKKAKVAQVTLTFDNDKGVLPSEYQTVAISRMLYQSGESEYRLNDVKCRLKDITNLFVDTGIGSNSYAIIALGMVDDILADKDNARRKMFEQAAGISKYKKRKKETLGKLKLTTEDLNRIDDLLFEIENNLKSLEKQARRTKKYFLLKDKYKDLSVQLAVIQSRDYKIEYDKLKGSISGQQEKLVELERRMHKFEAETEASKKGALDQERVVSEGQQKLHDIMSNLRLLESDKKIKNQKIDFIQENSKQLDFQLSNAKENEGNLNLQLVKQKELLIKAKEDESSTSLLLANVKEQNEELQEKYNLVKSSLDDHLVEKQAFDKQIFEKDKVLAINENRMQTNDLTISRNKELVQNQTFEKNQIDTELKDVKGLIQKQESLIITLESDESDREKLIEKYQTNVLDLDVEFNKIGREIDAKQNEYDLLKSMVDKLEGFPESIKFLNQNWNDKVPVLSDVIDCPEEYRIAIEQFLEPYLNHYIVDDIDQAKNAINMLAQAQKGKAKFFLLNEMPIRSPKVTVSSSLIKALDILDVEAKFIPLMRLLLDEVYLTDLNIDEMDALGMGEDITLVSYTSGIIKRRYTVSGGSIGLFEGKKLGRKKQLEKLEKILAKLKKKTLVITEEILVAKDKLVSIRLTDGKQKIKSYQIELSRNQQQKVQLSTKLQNLELNAKQYVDRVNELEKENSTIIKFNSDLSVELQEVRSKVETIDRSLKDKGGIVQKWYEDLASTSKRYNETNVSFIQKQNRCIQLDQEIVYSNKQLNELTTLMQREGHRLNENTTEFNELIFQVKQIESALGVAYKEKTDFEKTLHINQASYNAVRDSIFTIEKETRDTRTVLSNEQQILINLKDKFTDLRIKLTGIGERLFIEFKIKLENVINANIEVEQSMDELDQEVDKIRNRLSNYGEINPMALEAFDEMKTRYDNIIEQKRDIEEAKLSLIKTIEEIESTATLHFLKAFNDVKVHFRDVFRSLFTEDDDCDLILLDPENPLNSQIEIIAKPKGKRPKSLSQLSGGEKTLTAIALLFSLYLLKPAPFCIFDEVDAPLDDANILKFNKIIKDFSSRSQFIVVTHNKLTMAEVDVLYGVFMEEQGISNISEVDFRKMKHTPVVESVVN